MPRASLLLRERHVLAENMFAEVVVWHVPSPVPPGSHRFKYRLALIVDGVCVLRFDNEAGKGDHKHVGAIESPLRLHDGRATDSRILASNRAMESPMTAVVIGISTREETKARMRRAMRGERQGAFISFESVDLLWKVLTPKRWEIVRAMAGAGPLAIRGVARRVDRDVKSVHGDVQALLNAGVLDRNEDGRVEFPYDEIHVDFVVRAA